MNYAVPSNRVIRTNKELKTVCRLNKAQQQIREYCRSNDFVIRIDNTTKEPYAIAISPDDMDVRHPFSERLE